MRPSNLAVGFLATKNTRKDALKTPEIAGFVRFDAPGRSRVLAGRLLVAKKMEWAW
jgi:hypothetical protein